MFFGKSSYKQPEKGLPPGLRTQLLLLLGAFAVVAFVMQFARVLERAPRPDAGKVSGSVAGFGRPLEEPSGEERVAVSVAPPIEPQPPEPYKEDPEILSRGAKFDRTEILDEKLIAHLLQKVRSAEGQVPEIPALRLERANPSEVWEKLLKDPETYRGKLVEVKGEILDPGAGQPIFRLKGIEFPNPSGLDRAYQSFLFGIDGKYYMLATVEKNADLRHRDYVRIRAYFAQLYSYLVEYGGQLRQATIPFLVGGRYEVLRRPRIERGGGMMVLALVAGLGAVAVLAVVLLDARRLRRRRTPPPVFGYPQFSGRQTAPSAGEPPDPKRDLSGTGGSEPLPPDAAEAERKP